MMCLSPPMHVERMRVLLKCYHWRVSAICHSGEQTHQQPCVFAMPLHATPTQHQRIVHSAVHHVLSGTSRTFHRRPAVCAHSLTRSVFLLLGRDLFSRSRRIFVCSMFSLFYLIFHRITSPTPPVRRLFREARGPCSRVGARVFFLWF